MKIKKDEKIEIVEVEVSLEQILSNMLLSQRIAHRTFQEFGERLKYLIEEGTYNSLIVMLENYHKC